MRLFFDHPASVWLHEYRRSNPKCSWQEFLDAVYHNFDEDAIYFAETNKLLNKIMEAVAYLAKKEAMAKKEATSDSIVESVAKNDDESTTNVKSDPVIEEMEQDDDESPQVLDEAMTLVETKFPPKSHSQKITIVIIGYVTEVAEEISYPKIVCPSLVAVPNATILFANEDPNKDSDNEMEDYFSDFHLEGKVVFNGGRVDRDLIFYFIPEGS